MTAPKMGHHSGRERSGALIDWATVAGVMAAGAILVALIGWLAAPAGLRLPAGASAWRRAEMTAYAAFSVLWHDGAYADEGRTRGAPILLVARWLSVLALVVGAIVAASTLLRRDLAVWRSRRRSVRAVILGDHPIAQAFAIAAADDGVTVRYAAGVDARATGRRIELPWDGAETPFISPGAAVVIVAQGDGGGVGHASEIARRSSAAVRLHLGDPWAVHRFHQTGLERLTPFSEADLCARKVVADHPPVLLARRAGAERVHVLVVGLERLGEALITEVLLNGSLLATPVPVITVVDPDAARRITALRGRRSELDAICELRVAPVEAGAPLDLKGAPPICASYVSLGAEMQAVSAATALRERLARDAPDSGPIFVRLRDGEYLPRAHGVSGLRALGLYGFGNLIDLARSSGLLHADADAEAREAHEAYIAAAERLFGPADRSKPANRPWPDLAEGFRVASRRTAAHLRVKLIQAGFDVEPWLTAGSLPWAPPLAEPLFRDAEERTLLAGLEHQRWMVERQLEGWRLGARDDRRKLHPDLKPFQALSPQSQAFDFAVVDWLAQSCPVRADGLRRLS